MKTKTNTWMYVSRRDVCEVNMRGPPVPMVMCTRLDSYM